MVFRLMRSILCVYRRWFGVIMIALTDLTEERTFLRMNYAILCAAIISVVSKDATLVQA